MGQRDRPATRRERFPDTWFSDLPSNGLAERLRDQLRLVELESIDADLEGGAAFPDDQTQAGTCRAAEVDVECLVADATDSFRCDTRHCRGLAGIEAIHGTLASECLHDGQRCKPALARPLTRRGTANWCPGVDRHLQSRADLRLGEQRASFVRCERPDCVGQQNAAHEDSSECDWAHP